MMKLLAVIAVVTTAFLIYLSINSQPSVGVVEGVCRDMYNGRPVAGATVDIDLNQTDEDRSENKSSSTSDDPDLLAGAPSGWAQGSQSDTDLDLAGHDSGTRRHWEVISDQHGHFIFRNVNVGSYSISANSEGHLNQGQPLAVAEGTNELSTLTMTRSPQNLMFDAPGEYWATDQIPYFGLRGELFNPKVVFKLERLDIDDTIKHSPKFLLDFAATDYSAYPSGSLVRRWVETVTGLDNEGSFYNRIRCFDPSFGKPTPGIYRLTATSKADTSINNSVFFVVSDLALVSKAYGGKVLLHAVNIRTGKSIGGLSAYCMVIGEQSSRLLSQGKTDINGLCTLSSANVSPQTQGLTFIRRNSEIAATEETFNSPGDVDANSGASANINPTSRILRAFIYTDRPVYKPGQTVQLKGISRWYQSGVGFAAPANANVELVVTDAQNTTVFRSFATTNKFGSWTAAFNLSSETLTGQYKVSEHIGGQTAYGVFSVAAYHKPEYQVTVTFDKARYVKGDTIVATVTGTYYFGAPMSGATGSVDINKCQSVPGDNSEDGSEAQSGQYVDSSNFVLDGNGQAKVTISTNDEDDSDVSSADSEDNSQMTYTAVANVSDKSGSPVTSQASVIVAQGDFSITADASSTVANIGDLINVVGQANDMNGAPIFGKKLSLLASYDEWTDNQDKLTTFASTSFATKSDGTATYSFRVTKSGLIDIQFSGVDDRGNKVNDVAQIWVPDKNSDIPAQYSDISILLDRAKYKPGDTAHVLVTTAHPGPDALITVEGESIYKTLMVPLKRRATQIDLPVTEDDAPGVTVSVDCIVDKQYLSSSANLQIDDIKRALNITVQPNHTNYHPGDSAVIKLHAANSFGQPVAAELSVAVVDSAVFAIVPEPPGTITQAFLPEQGDQVVTSNSVQPVYYGDVDKGSTNIDIRRRFPDTALWRPDLVTDSNGNASVSLQLPDNLTTWRITCYGHTQTTMVGKSVGQMLVNKDLVLRLENPAFMVSGDKSTLDALIHDNTNRPLNVKFRLMPKGLTVIGRLIQDVTVQPGAPQKLSWPIQALSTGTYQPEATVQSGALNDGVATTIDVIPHGAKYVTWNSGSALYGATSSVTVSSRAIPSSTTLTVRLSPTLASALPPAAEYLSSYPYGSTDSTVSALISDATLYLAKGSLNFPEPVRSDLKDKAERSLLRSYQLQNDDGGWGWFSVDSSDTWMTAYAAYGLTLAKQSGLKVNPSILEAALNAVGSDSDTQRGKRFGDVDTQALALAALVLAKNGSPVSAETNLKFLNRGWTRTPKLEDNQDLATAAIAEQVISTPRSSEQAQQLMSQLWTVARETGDMISWTNEYHSSSAMAGEFEPDVNATAWCLLAAEYITPNDPRIQKAARWLVANRNDDHWSDPDATCTAVLALTKYLGATNELSPKFAATVTLNGKPIATVQFDESSIGNPDTVVDVPGDQLIPGSNLIELTKNGTGRLYYTLKLSQTLAVPGQHPPASFLATEFDHLLHPPRPLPPTSSGYRIKRIYMRLTSRRSFLWEDTVPTPDWQLNDGDSVLVRLIIDSTRPGSRIVVDEPVPPGFRIAETSGEFDENWDNWWDYTDVRDNDIVFFVSDLTTGRHEIDYHLVADRPGSYDVMPTLITSMVDPTLQASGAPSKVEVDGN